MSERSLASLWMGGSGLKLPPRSMLCLKRPLLMGSSGRPTKQPTAPMWAGGPEAERGCCLEEAHAGLRGLGNGGQVQLGKGPGALVPAQAPSPPVPSEVLRPGFHRDGRPTHPSARPISSAAGPAPGVMVVVAGSPTGASLGRYPWGC